VKLHLTNSSEVECVYEAIREAPHPYTLLSFAYKKLEPCYASTFTSSRCEIILDSGAFTAWNSGKTVDINKYVEWCLGFRASYSAQLARIRYINLDVIPGSKGVAASSREIELAAIQSMRNADFIRSVGLQAVEVFHQDEPFDLYDKIVQRAEGRLIAVSPRNDVSTKRREAWLRTLCAYTAKKYGVNNFPKAHGLAVTSETLVFSFPFYSVDSSSWTSCLRFGNSKASGLPKLPRWRIESDRHATAFALKAEVIRYQKMQDDATNLWRNRGIVFTD